MDSIFESEKGDKKYTSIYYMYLVENCVTLSSTIEKFQAMSSATYEMR